MALRHAEPALAVDAASGWPGGPGGFGRSELMRRIGFTLGALIVFRIGTQVPIPGLDPVEYLWMQADIVHAFPSSEPRYFSSPTFRSISALSGGALDRISIFSLGVMPYLSALMVMHLLAVVWPVIGRWKTAGGGSLKRFNRVVRYGTLVLAAMLGYAVAIELEGFGDVPPELAVHLALSGVENALIIEPGWIFRIQTAITLACGTMILVWLGERITARGVGNGIALIIFAGVAIGLLEAIAFTLDLSRLGGLPAWYVPAASVLAIGSLVLIVFMERAHRRVVVQQPAGRTAHMALRLNGAGMIPPIFAALLMPIFPISFGMPVSLVVYAVLIILFCFLLRAEVFDPAGVARSLERSGKYIAGIRPGRNTSDYLAYIQVRLTAVGAAYLAGVCVVWEALFPTYLGPPLPIGIALVTSVLVTLDLAATIAALQPQQRP